MTTTKAFFKGIVKQRREVTLDNSSTFEVPLDYFHEVKSLIQELSRLKLNPNTDYMELGLVGEIGFCKFLEKNSIRFIHRTKSDPTLMLEDVTSYDFESKPLRIDVKTTLVRPHKVSRILNIDQFQTIPKHSDVIVWCHFSSRHEILTIDSWTKTSELSESYIKQVTAPPDFSFTNEDSVDLAFTETMFVYEVPSFLMREIDDLIYLLKGKFE
jgi:hypothetical protein